MDEYNHIPNILREVGQLNQEQLLVGILDESGDYLQMIAVVNNDGTTITAKNAPYLMIPVRQSDGTLSFIRKKSVTIPARHFLERTIKRHEAEWQDYALERIPKVMDGTISGHELLDALGILAVTQMKAEITKFKTPKNSGLTVANKGRDDPLVDTGALRDAISYEIVHA